jgi:hypothetical protein
MVLKRPIPVNSKQAAKLGLGPKRSKYRAVPTVIDGIRFASKKEARRYSELKMLERAGSVTGLMLQVRYALTILDAKRDYRRLGDYVADFVYNLNGQHIVEDTKGFRTPLYRWKKKHFEAQYGLQIQEI